MSMRQLRVLLGCLAFGLGALALAQVPYTKIAGPVPIGTATTNYYPVLTGVMDGAANLQGTQGGGFITLLPSATRSAQVSTPFVSNYTLRGLIIVLNVTAASSTGGLSVTLQAQDPVSGTWYAWATLFTTVTTISLNSAVIYPVTFSGLNSAVATKIAAPLPAVWRMTVFVGDSSNYTYSLAINYLP